MRALRAVGTWTGAADVTAHVYGCGSFRSVNRPEVDRVREMLQTLAEHDAIESELDGFGRTVYRARAT
jgi:hypothetical protein